MSTAVVFGKGVMNVNEARVLCASENVQTQAVGDLKQCHKHNGTFFA